MSADKLQHVKAAKNPPPSWTPQIQSNPVSHVHGAQYLLSPPPAGANSSISGGISLLAYSWRRRPQSIAMQGTGQGWKREREKHYIVPANKAD